jgi:queuine/archaeosine tRNA-ribosyltransferase
MLRLYPLDTPIILPLTLAHVTGTNNKASRVIRLILILSNQFLLFYYK